MVDLPGYGYAKVGKKERGKWNEFIRAYLNNRPNLLYTFVLLDSRIPPQKIDLEFMEMLGIKGIPFIIIFTKVDKLSSSVLRKNMAAYQKELLKTWEALPPIIMSSSVNKLGRDEVLKIIATTNEEFKFQ